MVHETFWTLLQDPAHWEFELFLMVVFDLLIGALLWPYIKKHWVHHLDRDTREGIDEKENQCHQSPQKHKAKNKWPRPEPKKRKAKKSRLYKEMEDEIRREDELYFGS
jgi:hypothetical protein